MPHHPARALIAVGEALAHVPDVRYAVNADERQVLVTILADDDQPGNEALRLLQLSQVAEALHMPEPHTSRIGEDGARATTSDVPAYAPGVTVVVWTPVTAGVREVSSHG